MISEEELERRVKQLRENKRTAEPGDPIYQSGLRITSVPSRQPGKRKNRPAGGMITYPDDF